MDKTVHSKVLERAADLLGGRAELRNWLRVSMRDLDDWMEGAARPPAYVFLKAVDLLSEGRNSSALERRFRLRDSLLARGEAVAVRRHNVSANDFAASEFSPSEGERILGAALNAAVGGTAAARGNVQLVCPDGLRIVAHLGFEQPFLDFFARVTHDTPSTCGPAMKLARRVVVADVPAHPLFAGTKAAEVMERAGALACQSTPLVSGSGELLGMLSTHYEQPHEPSPEELQVVDLVARVASRWLSGAVA